MLREYKDALFFIGKYVLLYLLLNTGYAFFVESFKPGPDPVTILVTKNTASVLSVFDPSVQSIVVENSAYVPLAKDGITVVEVFEGCNSINVVIVFLSFIIAFTGPSKLFVKYALAGSVIIYLANLLRIIGLFEVALHFPNSLYFFHKFIFTGMIYGIVFIMWYFWTVAVKKWKTSEKSASPQ